MKKLSRMVVGASIIASALGFAATESKTSVKPEQNSGASHGIEVDQSNFKEIFNQSLASQQESIANESAGLDIEVAAQYTKFSELSLSNQYFDIDYGSTFGSMPFFQIGAGKTVWTAGGFRLTPAVSLGYSFKEAKTSVRAKKGTVLTDLVAIHSLPINLGTEFKHRIPGTRRFSVFAAPSIGMNWFNQTGSLDGINQSYWIPNYGIRAGFVLFESESGSAGMGDWFNGVSLSTGRRASFSSTQKFSLWSVDLGLKILL